MKTFLWILAAFTLAAILCVAYFMIAALKKSIVHKPIKDAKENLCETGEENYKKARAVRGNDKWLVSVYPSGCANGDNSAIKSTEISVLSFVYDVPRKYFRIGLDSDGKPDFYCEENEAFFVTFYQDTGMCLVNKKDGIYIKLTDGLVYQIGDYDIAFTYLEKSYSGFIVEKSDSNQLTEASDYSGAGGGNTVRNTKKAIKKESEKLIGKFVKWFKKNI